jgi:hypothetical protein
MWYFLYHIQYKKYFNVSICITIHKNKIYDTRLSLKGENNLKKFLVKDHECLEKLYDLGFLDKKYE